MYADAYLAQTDGPYSAACIRRIPFHRSPQTPSMTKGSLRSPCSPQDTSRWHFQRQTPAPVKISRKAQQMMTVSTLFVIQFFFLFVLSNKVFWLYFLFNNRNLWFYIPDKIISILFIQFYALFFFYVLSSFLFPAHKRLIYVSISFRLFRKFYRSEIIFYDVWFPIYLKNFGGYTFSCSLNNSGLNFLNSKPFVISVLCDLLIQIDLLGFSPLQFFKVSWKKVPARFFYF